MRANEIVDLALFVAQGFTCRTDNDDPTVGQNDFRRKNVIGSRAVDWNVRAGRIVRDHAADGGARAGSDVGPKTKSVRLEKRVQLIEDDTGAGAHAAFVDIEIVDLAIVAREIDDQSFADRVSNQAGTGAARRDRNVFIGRDFNDRARVLRAGWEGDAKRLDLVNRSVSGVKLAGEIIETHVAA